VHVALDDAGLADDQLLGGADGAIELAFHTKDPANLDFSLEAASLGEEE